MSNDLSIIKKMATRFSMEQQPFQQTIVNTAFPNGKATNEQLAAFLLVASEYDLNPFTKEIYAFPSRGGIQPIVSIDGWLKIINSHPQFDGMEFKDAVDENGSLVSITCKIFRKDRSHATEVTEYISECRMGTEPWKKYPARMLRHKSAIQCARYAFSFSGIVDPDEAERIKEIQEVDMGNAEIVTENIGESFYTDADFKANLPKWKALIETGRASAEQIISMAASKAEMTLQQKSELEIFEQECNQ